MNRRDALKVGLAAVATGVVGATTASEPASTQYSFGWESDPASLKEYVRHQHKPYVSQVNAAIKGTGKGRKASLHLALEAVTGRKYVPRDQGGYDCVGCAAALGVDILAATQVVSQQLDYPERWTTHAASEPIYGGSRVEIGGTRRQSIGSTGHWAAQWLTEYGVLHRQKYPGHDLTKYDTAKAAKWGREGVPDGLEAIAKQHPVTKTAICTSYGDLRDLIFNGSPVMVCSNVGFGGKAGVRDSQGFLRRRLKPWPHAMLFAGFDDTHRRPGALCFNSWGDNWITGPTRGNQPKSTFWVDASTVTSMLSQGDSIAFSAYDGFERIDVPNYILH